MKNENIFIPDFNLFQDKSDAFIKGKKAKSLQKKYQPSPYEEEYKPLYWLAFLGSFLCEGISILTASTWLFSYIFSIVKDVPTPGPIAFVFTGLILIILEVLQRITGTKFFRYYLQYDKIFYSLLVGALFCAMTSMTFSFLGGFDLVKTITTPPLYEKPVLLDIEKVEKRYQKFIDDAESTAANYYERRKYQGRIATEDAAKYQDYLDKKMAYQDSLVLAIQITNKKNEDKVKEARQRFQTALIIHENKNNSKGAGLGGIAIFSSLLLYLCLWYMEYFDFRTVTQYGILVTNSQLPTQKKSNQEPVLTLEDYQKVLNLLQEQEQQTPTNNAVHSPTPAPSQEETKNNAINHFKAPQMPIGYYSEEQRQAKLKERYIQHIQPYIQDFKSLTIAISDKHTVEHKNFRTGETEHLDFKTVNNRTSIYLLKIKNAIGKGNMEVLPNQFDKLHYWLNKRGEFLEK